jgi:Family of unknown function (DUF6502)
MTPPKDPDASDTADAHQRQLQALQGALRALLVPLARLSVARGLPYSAVEEILKLAFVQAASDAHPQLLPHRKVSRISTVTGINRREVTRLTQAAAPARPRGRSLVSELYAHWLADPRYRGRFGEPLTLPRQGPAPSFESLAQEITRDVHPRSLLDEMLRLQLAYLDADTDNVRPSDSASPGGDIVPVLGYLGDNVGDHLSAAVDNALLGPQSHLEQALFADGASDETIEWLRQMARQQWHALRSAIVPELERRIEADAKTEPPASQRLRVGLYVFDDRRRALPPAPTDLDDGEADA